MVGTANNSLSYYLDLSVETASTTRRSMQAAMGFLDRVDRLFVELIPALGVLPTPVAGVLIMNSHAGLRAAAGLAVTGQLMPVYMCLRGAIESALYSNGMVVDRPLEAVWLERDRDPAARRRCREAFGIERMVRLLVRSHDQDFGDRVMEAYQATIDFGAHPNSRPILRDLQFKEHGEGHTGMSFTYMHGPESSQVRQALVACAEIGLTVFYIALIAHPTKQEIRHLNERALAVHAEIPALVRDLGLIQRI